MVHFFQKIIPFVILMKRNYLVPNTTDQSFSIDYNLPFHMPVALNIYYICLLWKEAKFLCFSHI